MVQTASAIAADSGQIDRYPETTSRRKMAASGNFLSGFAMRRFLLVLALFACTVLLLGTYLVIKIGPKRIIEAEQPCPEASPPNYSRAFWPDQEVADLCAAATMVPRQAVTHILRRAIPVRTYVAIELMRDCSSTPSVCNKHLGDPVLESAIDQRLDSMLPQSIEDSNDFTSASIWMTSPFPWKGFIALRGDLEPYAAISFEMTSDALLSRQRIEEQYGVAAHQNTNNEGYLSLEYPSAGPGYTSMLTILVDPLSNRVRRVTVGVTRQ
jgi:hypothetical protein